MFGLNKELINNFFKQFSVFLLIMVALYFIVDSLIFPMYTRHGEEYDLEDFTEKKVEEAKSISEEWGYELIIKDSTFSPLHESGVIIAQQPKAFSRVKYGRRIYLTVSLGDKPIYVPKLTGISSKNATFMIEAKGLIVGEILTEYSSSYEKDVVMAQTHEQGTQLVTGDTVGFTVSLGQDFTAIPIEDYTGLPFKKAKNRALSRGLVVKMETGDKREDVIPGTVVAQSLDVDTFAELNDVIIFTVSQ